ncbi:GPI mannosyltransferase 2, partial [Caligus rogercresseyi]
MKNVAVETILFVRKRKSDKSHDYSIPLIFQNIWVKTFFPGICNVLAATLPFAFFQWFAYTAYCVKSGQSFHPHLLKNGKFRNMPPTKKDNVSSWCGDDTPISYFYVHSTYGSLGLAQLEDIDELPLILLS